MLCLTLFHPARSDIKLINAPLKMLCTTLFNVTRTRSDIKLINAPLKMACPLGDVYAPGPVQRRLHGLGITELHQRKVRSLTDGKPFCFRIADATERYYITRYMA